MAFIITLLEGLLVKKIELHYWSRALMTLNDEIQKWLEIGEEILQAQAQLSPKQVAEIKRLLTEVISLKTTPPPRLYLIVNEGVHPIVEDLKQQFGENIEYEVVTRGNVTLEEEAQVARRVKEILEKHRGREIVIVPSGLPYLITVVYNTVYQITSKHPVYL
ncbi:MAG: hypothetical protein D6732_12385, partial [Methanobacteriota archaeon]